MVRLHDYLPTRWDAEPFVVRLTTNKQRPGPLRPSEGLLVPGGGGISLPPGFRLYLCFESEGQCHDRTVVVLPESLSYLRDGDILRIVPRTGELHTLYRKASRSNAISATHRCNSNCIMCSQPPRTKHDACSVGEWITAISLMDRGTPELMLSGGEPTLLGDGFLRLVQACRNWLPQTPLHILSNGRMFAYLTLASELAAIRHPDLMVGVPLYSDIACQHDFIVQAPGAFDQAIRGIMNLARCAIRVEIRVVLHQATVPRLPHLARFIARNLPYVSQVALMGLELTGYARPHLEALWIDPVDYQPALHEAVLTLARQHMYPVIFNHQLCTLDRRLWEYARKSISDWKNEFVEECDRCAARSLCGGFFESSRIRRSRAIAPVSA